MRSCLLTAGVVPEDHAQITQPMLVAKGGAKRGIGVSNAMGARMTRKTRKRRMRRKEEEDRGAG